MLYKEDMEELLLSKNKEEVLTIYYEGFTGRGINGMSEKFITVRNLSDDTNVVQNIKYGDESYKIIIVDLDLKANYIKATFKKYRKPEYDKEYYLNREYTTIVPYTSIQSIEIEKI